MATKSVVSLALECSAGQASAAIGVDGNIITQSSLAANHGHAAWMVPLVQEAIGQSPYNFDDITHILAGRGPGSFTGIRVALAAAKGLGLSLEVDVIGLSSLAGMAASIRRLPAANGRHVMTMIDSRRGSIFCQAFTPDGVSLTSIQNMEIDGILDQIKKEDTWTIAGYAAAEIAALSPNVIAVDHDLPHASDLIALYEDQKIDLPENHLEPLYLSAPLLGLR